MDAFEQLIASLIFREGYWTTTSFKVELTKQDKLKIHRPSSPRWELDVVGYSPARNEILVVECKSYLDSRGVTHAMFERENGGRLKLFTDWTLWRVVRDRLKRQLSQSGLTCESPSVKLALATGRIPSGREREALASLFKRRRWVLLDEEWICSRLARFSDDRYENDIGIVVAKLLLRNKKYTEQAS